MKHIVLSFILTAVLFCSCGNNSTKSEITAEMAYEGVSNYCHSAYDWSVAKELLFEVSAISGKFDITVPCRLRPLPLSIQQINNKG